MTFRVGARVKVPDGRIGIIVYNGLDGQGVIWREELLTEQEKEQILSACPLFEDGKPQGFNLFPEAMLRRKELSKAMNMECVGEEYECEEV